MYPAMIDHLFGRGGLEHLVVGAIDGVEEEVDHACGCLPNPHHWPAELRNGLRVFEPVNEVDDVAVLLQVYGRGTDLDARHQHLHQVTCHFWLFLNDDLLWTNLRLCCPPRN